MNAWLLTWEGTSGPAVAPDKKIVAIVSARLSPKKIEEFADLLYSRSVDSAYDMARSANTRKARIRAQKHMYSTPSRLFYGQNPCIFARVVSDLTIDRDEEAGVERVSWVDPPYYRVPEPGALPVEAEPAKKRQLVRPIRPLSRDLYDREV
jgi:hypothetical protein